MYKKSKNFLKKLLLNIKKLPLKDFLEICCLSGKSFASLRCRSLCPQLHGFHFVHPYTNFARICTKPCFVQVLILENKILLCTKKLPLKDSNLDSDIQSVASCH